MVVMVPRDRNGTEGLDPRGRGRSTPAHQARPREEWYVEVRDLANLSDCRYQYALLAVSV